MSALMLMVFATVACVAVDVENSRFMATALTVEPGDTYSFTSTGVEIYVSAPVTNTGGNTRLAFWRSGATASVDQSSCATWSDQSNHGVQQGAALRIRQSESEVRAITVTKNVWGGPYVFNVHVWDSSDEVAMTQVDQHDLTNVFVREGTVAPLPWRMCARATGSRLDVIVWPLDGRATPEWGDPAHGRATTLPDGWDVPGLPGWYVGHLRGGEHATLVDLAVEVDAGRPES